jgi:ABC-type glycerol-3-phosphate transport system permease component
MRARSRARALVPFATLLPMSLPIVVVAAFMQVTGVWNDAIPGLVFAGRDSRWFGCGIAAGAVKA